MELCSGGRNAHELIVYGGGTCPLCEAITDIARLEREIEKLADELEAAQS